MPSVGFLNYQCKPCYILESTQLWSKLNYQCKPCYILNSTQLWSKLNYQGKPCPILNSTQQHSFCILIRSDLSSMQLNAAQCNSARQLVSLWSKLNAAQCSSLQLNSILQCHAISATTAQLNSVRQLVSMSYHLSDPSRTNWHCHYLRLCNCNLLTLSTSQQKQKQNPPTKEKYHEPQEWMFTPTFLV